MHQWTSEYTARFAPIGEWHYAHGQYERFGPKAFHKNGLSWKFREASRNIPVVLGHNKTQPVGRIEAMWPDEFDGWWMAAFRLNASLLFGCVAADNIREGLPVSPSFGPAVWRDEGDTRLYELCWLSELSLLIRGSVPAYKGAQVTRVKDISDELMARPRAPVVASSPAAVTTSSNRAAAGEDDYRPPVWDELERIVGYPITDANQEQAFLDANRSPLDKLLDEYKAAKRTTEPQVIFRPGIGQVLGVR